MYWQWLEIRYRICCLWAKDTVPYLQWAKDTVPYLQPGSWRFGTFSVAYIKEMAKGTEYYRYGHKKTMLMYKVERFQFYS